MHKCKCNIECTRDHCTCRRCYTGKATEAWHCQGRQQHNKSKVARPALAGGVSFSVFSVVLLMGGYWWYLQGQDHFRGKHNLSTLDKMNKLAV